MSDETSARHGLPLLAPGQAQKEMTHNEALAMLDLVVQPAVETLGVTVPPLAPGEGQCWIVGAGATGSWEGHDDALAGWTAGGWRFVVPREGMLAWVIDASAYARFDGAGWAGGHPLGSALSATGDPTGRNRCRRRGTHRDSGDSQQLACISD